MKRKAYFFFFRNSKQMSNFEQPEETDKNTNLKPQDSVVDDTQIKMDVTQTPTQYENMSTRDIEIRNIDIEDAKFPNHSETEKQIATESIELNGHVEIKENPVDSDLNRNDEIMHQHINEEFAIETIKVVREDGQDNVEIKETENISTSSPEKSEEVIGHAAIVGCSDPKEEFVIETTEVPAIEVAELGELKEERQQDLENVKVSEEDEEMKIFHESESDSSSESSVSEFEFDDDEVALESKEKTEILRTKNEVLPVPKEITVSVDCQISPLGTLESIVEGCCVIKQTCKEVLNISAVILYEDRFVLGEVEETFGNVKQPFYTVRVLDVEQHKDRIGSLVYYVKGSAIVNVEELKRMKGTDASNLYDEETDEEFSDDEKEREAKKKRKNPEVDGNNAAGPDDYKVLQRPTKTRGQRGNNRAQGRNNQQQSRQAPGGQYGSNLNPNNQMPNRQFAYQQQQHLPHGYQQQPYQHHQQSYQYQQPNPPQSLPYPNQMPYAQFNNQYQQQRQYQMPVDQIQMQQLQQLGGMIAALQNLQQTQQGNLDPQNLQQTQQNGSNLDPQNQTGYNRGFESGMLDDKNESFHSYSKKQ